jgi:predicted nucleotidyltransferase
MNENFQFISSGKYGFGESYALPFKYCSALKTAAGVRLCLLSSNERYLQALSRQHIPIKEAVLFGSYAKGNETEWSDIDIALVSEIFEGDRMADKDKIRKITLAISSEIEVMPFPPNDINEQNPFAREILKTGIKLI